MAGAGDLDGTWRSWLVVLGAVVAAGLRLRVEGAERIPASGAALLAGNHVSSLDGIVLAVTTARLRRRRTRFLVAAEFFANPVYAPLLRSSGQIPIRRGASDLGALDEAKAALRSGTLAGIYPEGGVNPDPDAGLRPGRSGAARIALTTGVPVVPVGIWGTQVRWPYAGWSFARPFRPRVGLAFGPPIEAEGSPERPADVQGFTDRVMAGIAVELERAKALAGRR